MVTYIWYNPIIDIYQKGSQEEYNTLLGNVDDKDSFTVLFELSELSSRLAEKLLNELNSIRLEEAI